MPESPYAWYEWKTKRTLARGTTRSGLEPPTISVAANRSTARSSGTRTATSGPGCSRSGDREVAAFAWGLVCPPLAEDALLLDRHGSTERQPQTLRLTQRNYPPYTSKQKKRNQTSSTTTRPTPKTSNPPPPPPRPTGPPGARPSYLSLPWKPARWRWIPTTPAPRPPPPPSPPPRPAPPRKNRPHP